MSQGRVKRKILIVEDQEINRKILVKLLGQDYDIVCASNGKEAIELMRKHILDLSAVLLDLIMPVMDGYEVLRQMRADTLLSDIPVLVASQKDGDNSELEALNLGANDFISKPYNAGILRLRLQNLISMHEASVRIDALERDSVTGLYTKAAFAQRVTETLKEHPDLEMDIVALDIDHFKLVNESYGTQTGDSILRFVAELIQGFIDFQYSICARYYADQFLLFVRQIDTTEAQNILKEMSEALALYPIDMKLQIRMGIYHVIDTSMEVNAMCDRALLAVHQLKGHYEQVVAYYDDSLREQLLMEQYITDDMENALAQKQFEVYFQPKYDIYSEQLSGAEALIRWQHPERGFMSPGQFIPVFERNGFITEVDMFVWDKTCEKIREWIDKYDRYVPISVNVSRKDIYRPNLTQILLDTVHKYHLKPEQLHLEITESAYVENSDQLLKVVAELKDAGFMIEMDDFGSGYSSLNMLADMPIDTLKLDMRFVQNYSEKNNTRNIMSFVIGLAKFMNLYVIAEGVETAEQLDMLRGMDCNLAQGYYFSKPLKEEAFVELLKESGKSLNNQADQMVRYSAVHDGKYQTMMLVDPLAINRAMLTEIFKKSYTIVEATSGQAAIQYLKHVSRVDIILMEAHLPDMDGYELIRELKKNPMLENIPIIVSTHGTDETINKVLAEGADAYIKKPYSRERVHECISRVMSAVGERMKHEEEEILRKMRMMEMLATKDYLTGLWNRVELERRITEHIKHSESSEFYFISIDIDRFQSLINSKGYSAGDKVLNSVAQKISSCFDESSDAVGRISGDRYAVFFNEPVDLDELKVRMYHLQTVLSHELNGMKITCSSGVSKYPACGKSFDELYQAAEHALEDAKKSGRDCFRMCFQA
ncbi:MAG: EAL domain-containing protein [bacterium]|nr:EAL domain-containing protein [bacterium]